MSLLVLGDYTTPEVCVSGHAQGLWLGLRRALAYILMGV